MTDRIDHAAEAEKLLSRAAQFSEPDVAEISADLAGLTHSVLALVEQQRIATMTAVVASAARGVAEGTHSRDDYLKVYGMLNPLIAAGLGIGGDDEPEELRDQIADEIAAEREDTDPDDLGASAYINGLRRAEEITRNGR